MPLSEQRKQSMYKYAKEKLKRIPLDVQKEKYEEIKSAATEVSETVNGYIKVAIDERMERQQKRIKENQNMPLTLKTDKTITRDNFTLINKAKH